MRLCADLVKRLAIFDLGGLLMRRFGCGVGGHGELVMFDLGGFR